MSETADVIVAGLGAMGSAACWQLATRGLSVIGLDRHHPPHPYGSTHGESRITRLAIGEGPDYVPLVRRSHELWPEIEARTGARLLTITGGLILGPPGNRFLEQTRASARRYGIGHENLSPDEVADRFPMFAADGPTEAYYEPTAGYVRPEEAVRAQLGLGRELGARLRFGETVTGWRSVRGGVEVDTDRGTYGTSRLVLSVGAWLPGLFVQGADLFAVHRQIQYWFEIRRGYERLRDMPVFVWDFEPATDEWTHFVGFYGFPALDGPAGGLKVGTETYERRTAPNDRQHPATPAEIEHMYGRYLGRHLPWLGPTALRTASCLYTNTRGSRFLIDHHPDDDRVLIVSPCSGHGFKHSPAIGEAVADWLSGGPPAVDLRPFSLAPTPG